MKIGKIAIGTGILLALAVAVGLIQSQPDKPPPRGKVGESLLGGRDLSPAVKIEIVEGEDKVTLLSTGEGWQVAEMDSFPADADKIRKFIIKLDNTLIGHKVTDNPDKLAGLGLLKLSENDGKAERNKTAATFKVTGGQDKPLYELLLGNDRTTTTTSPGAAGGQYVRFGEDSSAYLIPEMIFLNTKAQDWLEAELFNFDKDRAIRKITLSRAGKEELIFSRLLESQEWELAGADKDEVKTNDISALANRISKLKLFKVIAKDGSKKEIGRTKVANLKLELFDKTSYDITIGEEKAEDNVRYLTLAASLPDKVEEKALQDQAAAFNKRFGARYIAIYEWEAEQILKKRGDFLKKK